LTDIPQYSEQDLIEKCKLGNLAAQERLYKHFYGYAMGVGLRYAFNHDDALEVANDSFIKVFTSIQTFNTEQPFKPWLRKIIVNTAIDRRRRELKYLQDVEIDQAVTVQSSAHIIERLTAQDILKLLDELPDLLRMVFNLHEIDGYSHEEISALLNIPASSSRVYLSRAKNKLKHELIRQDQLTDGRIRR
jgi:RNA polymerase sigma factor (sigma-70 family)